MGNSSGHEENSNHTFEGKDLSVFSQISVTKTDAEWKAQLSAEEYRILRHKGTERSHTGKNWDNHKKGTYFCAGCDRKLFR